MKNEQQGQQANGCLAGVEKPALWRPCGRDWAATKKGLWEQQGLNTEDNSVKYIWIRQISPFIIIHVARFSCLF